MINFSVDKSEFLKHIFFCVGIVDTRSTMLVLSHIYLEARDDRVFISSTDLESSIYSSFPAKINSAGSICISGKKLFDVVEKLPDEKINVSLTTDSHIENSFSTQTSKDEPAELRPRFGRATRRSWRVANTAIFFSKEFLRDLC